MNPENKKTSRGGTRAGKPRAPLTPRQKALRIACLVLAILAAVLVTVFAAYRLLEMCIRDRVETAQAQQRQHEDAILKLEERLAHFDAQLADASRRRDEQRRELEQIQARSAQTEADTAAARARIEALEGSAAALRAEAEGKAQGQSELQARTAGIREAIAELNMRLSLIHI